MKKQKKNISVDMSIVTPWRQYRDILPIVLDHTYISAIKNRKESGGWHVMFRRYGNANACIVQEIWKRQLRELTHALFRRYEKRQHSLPPC